MFDDNDARVATHTLRRDVETYDDDVVVDVHTFDLNVDTHTLHVRVERMSCHVHVIVDDDNDNNVAFVDDDECDNEGSVALNVSHAIAIAMLNVTHA